MASVLEEIHKVVEMPVTLSSILIKAWAIKKAAARPLAVTYLKQSVK